MAVPTGRADTVPEAIDLERYLHEHIPLSKAMQVTVVDVRPEGVTLRAPLAPNINHRDTIFGGSASAVAILAGWSLLHARLAADGMSSRLVIQRNTMDYDLPMADAFTARSFLRSPQSWERFIAMLRRKGRGRISVSCVIECGGRVAGRLEGEFVALGSP